MSGWIPSTMSTTPADGQLKPVLLHGLLKGNRSLTRLDYMLQILWWTFYKYDFKSALPVTLWGRQILLFLLYRWRNRIRDVKNLRQQHMGPRLQVGGACRQALRTCGVFHRADQWSCTQSLPQCPLTGVLCDHSQVSLLLASKIPSPFLLCTPKNSPGVVFVLFFLCETQVWCGYHSHWSLPEIRLNPLAKAVTRFHPNTGDMGTPFAKVGDKTGTEYHRELHNSSKILRWFCLSIIIHLKHHIFSKLREDLQIWQTKS